MRRLILFRHGKAEAHSASGDDFDRRLETRGEIEAGQMGRRLAALGFTPDLVLVSAARRTRDTWDAAAPALDGAQVRFEDELYHADSANIWRIAEQAGADAGTVLVIGHNPGLHELTLRLMLAGEAEPALLARAQRQFPTSCAALFELAEDGAPKAVDLLLPER